MTERSAPDNSTAGTLKVLATGANGLADKGALGGCVNLATGIVKLTKTLDKTLTTAAAIPCT